MNKKGEENIVAGILIVFIAIIVGLLLYQAITPFVGDMTGANLGTFGNSTITMPSSGGTLDLTGQELVGTPIITNVTSGAVVPTTNYTMTEGVGSDGVKGIILTSLGGDYSGLSVNASWQYYPDGYIDNAGGRSLALLIPIFAALAIAILGLIPSVRSGLMDMIK